MEQVSGSTTISSLDISLNTTNMKLMVVLEEKNLAEFGANLVDVKTMKTLILPLLPLAG